MRHESVVPPRDFDTRDFVARFRAGDESAFKAVFDAYWNDLCAFASRYVHANDAAEDVVQSVFLRLAEQRYSWDGGRNLRAYLYAATRNAALDALRHAGVEAKWAAAVRDLSPALGTPPRVADAELTDAEITNAVNGALQSLSPRVRLVAMHRLYDRLSRAEIATLVGTSEETVHKQLGTALKRLRERLRHLREP